MQAYEIGVISYDGPKAWGSFMTEERHFMHNDENPVHPRVIKQKTYGYSDRDRCLFPVLIFKSAGRRGEKLQLTLLKKVMFWKYNIINRKRLK